MVGWGVVALAMAGAYLVGLTLWSVLVVAAVAEDERQDWDPAPDDDDEHDEDDGDDDDSGGGPVAGRDALRQADCNPRGDWLPRRGCTGAVRRAAGLRVQRVVVDRYHSSLAADASAGRDAGDPVSSVRSGSWDYG